MNRVALRRTNRAGAGIPFGGSALVPLKTAPLIQVKASILTAVARIG
jgi:hypothetical protein